MKNAADDLSDLEDREQEIATVEIGIDTKGLYECQVAETLTNDLVQL
jgi:hypothetical protein